MSVTASSSPFEWILRSFAVAFILTPLIKLLFQSMNLALLIVNLPGIYRAFKGTG